jgi:hypothetical protein
MGEYVPYARLICEHDEGGEMFTALCPDREFPSLEPYAALLNAWRQDTLGHEKPVVPIDYDRNGDARFSSAGSRTDFPERHRTMSQVLRRVGLNRELTVQFRNASAQHPYWGGGGGASDPRGRKQSTAFG